MARSPAVVWLRVASASNQSPPPRAQAAFAILDSRREVPAMIVFFHPRSTRPKNRRFPLAVLSIAAMIEGKEDYAIVDGNADPDPCQTIDRLMGQHNVELLAVSVMPGPQMAAAIPVCKAFREKHPRVPIVWGGYFPSLYADTALNAR